jgi:hypothetical protein
MDFGNGFWGMLRPGRMTFIFALAGLIAPAIRGADLLWPGLFPFKHPETVDRAFDFVLFFLWPMSSPVAAAIRLGGATALGAFLFGIVTNVIRYGFIGTRVREEIIWRRLQR